MLVGAVLILLVAVIVAAIVQTDDGSDDAVRSGTSTTGAALRPEASTTSGAATVTDTTAPPPPTTTTTAVGPCDTAGAILKWPLRRRLGQLLMIGVPPTSSAGAHAAVEAGAGGVFIERTPKSTAIYTSGDLRGLADRDGVPVAVAVDDEGGLVQSIATLDGDLPSARTLSAEGPAEIERLASARAAKLKSYGVTVDLAPVVDLDDDTKGVIGTRSFSPDPETTTSDALAFARGVRSQGLTPVFKHFPGHGRASGDSHKGTVTTPPLAELEKHDLIPYRSVVNEPGAWILVGHLDVPGLTDGEPASISPAAIGLLRNDFGFDGVVISDELGGMAAISGRYPLEEAIGRFLAAGGDIALWNGPTASIDKVLDALERDVAGGRLSEAQVNASVRRVLAAKGYDPCAAS